MWSTRDASSEIVDEQEGWQKWGYATFLDPCIDELQTMYYVD